jgi:tetratricopeptide (TPR) repeat protein
MQENLCDRPCHRDSSGFRQEPPPIDGLQNGTPGNTRGIRAFGSRAEHLLQVRLPGRWPTLFNQALLFQLLCLGMLGLNFTETSSLAQQPAALLPHISSSSTATSAESLLARAERHTGTGETEAALSDLNLLLDQIKQQVRSEEQRRRYLERGRQLAMILRSRNSQSFPVNFVAAELLFLENQPKEALSLLMPFREQSKTNPDYLSLLGVCYVRTSQLQNALQAFKEAIVLAPDRADLYFQLAGLYQAARDNESAIQILNKALAKGLQSAQIYFTLGLSEFNLGNFDAAIERFRQAIQLQPDFAKAYYYVGRSTSKLGDEEAAATAYRKAISADPADYHSHYELALLLLNGSRLQEALTEFQQVLRLNPKSADAYYQQGKIYSKQGHVPDAIQSLERAITLNSDLDGAYQELGQIYLRIGKREKAQEVLNLLNDKKQKRKEQFEQKVSGKGGPS